MRTGFEKKTGKCQRSPWCCANYAGKGRTRILWLAADFRQWRFRVFLVRLWYSPVACIHVNLGRALGFCWLTSKYRIEEAGARNVELIIVERRNEDLCRERREVLENGRSNCSTAHLLQIIYGRRGMDIWSFKAGGRIMWQPFPWRR